MTLRDVVVLEIFLQSQQGDASLKQVQVCVCVWWRVGGGHDGFS